MLNITVSGADEVRAMLKQIGKNVKDLSPAFKEMEAGVIQEFKANFDAKGGLLSGGWPPRKRSYPWPILNKTGKLKSGWQPKSSRQDLTIKSTTDYAGYHHFGTAYLPVRKLVGMSSAISELVASRIIKFIKSNI